jgi:hypothetical protein
VIHQSVFVVVVTISKESVAPVADINAIKRALFLPKQISPTVTSKVLATINLNLVKITTVIMMECP